MVSEKTRVRVLAIGMLCLLLLVAILMIWQFSDALFMDPPAGS